MSIQDIEVTTWLLWVAIGIVAALVASAIFGGRKMLGYDLFVGVVCSIAGGWGSALAIGDNSQSTMIISALTAFFACILAVYILNKIAVRDSRKNKNNDNES